METGVKFRVSVWASFYLSNDLRLLQTFNQSRSFFLVQDNRLQLPHVTSIDEVTEKRRRERYIFSSF